MSSSNTIFSEESAGTVKNGQTFEVVLKSNPTTGFSWTFLPTSETAAAGVVKLVSNEYRATPVGSGIVGSGGHHHWVFTAVGAGSASLEFQYSRSWEHKAPNADKAFKITVE